ncbi:MAG TPA: response regulator [Steroidobacteraceae bacterium]|nr:response regulator [Steroidobacteraceae bacterium]
MSSTMSTGQRSIAALRILVAEDDGMVAEAICDRLTDAGVEVVARADTGEGAVEAALTLRPDLILMDVRLKGGMDGIRASELINEKMRVPVVYLTGDSDQKTLQRAKAASAYGYVLKPFHIRNLIGAIEVAVDRFEMERRLEESQLTYATILGSIADGVIAVDTQGCVRFMNGVAERLTGWSTRDGEREQLGTVLNLVDSGDDEAAKDLVARVLNSRNTLAFGRDAFVISREGVRVPVDGGMSCVVDSLDRVVGACITLRNVTNARKAESERRQLEAALLDAVGREQHRFGTDLHDGLGQELTGLALLLSALTNTARASHSPHAADFEQACEVARHAAQSCQTIARGLSPIGPAEGGLIGALRNLVARLKGRSGPSVDISVNEVSRLGLSAAASDHLYRIAQEAIQNALKHAHANTIKVTLDVEREHVRLEIRDDGGGVKEVTEGAQGLGLRTMQYRASMIGARFEIAPFRPSGTRVICDCPH